LVQYSFVLAPSVITKMQTVVRWRYAELTVPRKNGESLCLDEWRNITPLLTLTSDWLELSGLMLASLRYTSWAAKRCNTTARRTAVDLTGTLANLEADCFHCVRNFCRV